jgi:hypothetical protein
VFTCVLICLVLLMDGFSSLIFIYKGFSSSLMKHKFGIIMMVMTLLGFYNVLGRCLKSLRFLCKREGHLTVSRQDFTFLFFFGG